MPKTNDAGKEDSGKRDDKSQHDGNKEGGGSGKFGDASKDTGKHGKDNK